MCRESWSPRLCIHQNKRETEVWNFEWLVKNDNKIAFWKNEINKYNNWQLLKIEVDISLLICVYTNIIRWKDNVQRPILWKKLFAKMPEYRLENNILLNKFKNFLINS